MDNWKEERIAISPAKKYDTFVLHPRKIEEDIIVLSDRFGFWGRIAGWDNTFPLTTLKTQDHEYPPHSPLAGKIPQKNQSRGGIKKKVVITSIEFDYQYILQHFYKTP